MLINSNTILYCIFGNPARHSFSPILHNYAFALHNINAVYLAFEIDSIKKGIESFRTLGINGASITIPFKIEVINYIDEIDSLSSQIGSVNTLRNENGKIKGYNTDGSGAVRALMNNNVKIENRNVMIIGNGGSARAIAFSLLKESGNIFIAGRDRNKVSGLAKDLKSFYDHVDTIELIQINKNFMKNIDIIINTTPIGMRPNINSTPLDSDLLDESHVVFDIVYSPEITRFLHDAIEKKCKIIKGIDMLIYQGIKQFEIWTGIKPLENKIIEYMTLYFSGRINEYK